MSRTRDLPPRGYPPIDKYTRLANDLARQGWSVDEDFFACELAAALKEDAQRWSSAGLFAPAGIGRGDSRQVRGDVRGDRIAWLDNTLTSPASHRFQGELERLRLTLNETLFLGLFEFEGHWATYSPGTCYQRHVDQHQGTETRAVSCVTYLNEAWQAGDGGELRLYPTEGDSERVVDVTPRAGTLVCFISAELPHEVLPARRTRYSLTGWYRRRES